jgi:hypothetical protein
MMVGSIAEWILAIMAIVAGIISWKEYKSRKQKENNKLLSQLNRRYINNEDIQTVIRFL